MGLLKNITLALFFSGSIASAFPSFDPFTSAAGSGGTSYANGAVLYHQTNAMLEGWSLWNGGSTAGAVTCLASNLSYASFPAGFPAPPPAAVSLPGSAFNVSGEGAALQFSRAMSANPNPLVTNRIYASFLLQIPNLGNLDSGSPIYFGGFATNSGDQNVALPSKAMKLFLKGNNGTPGLSTTYALGIQNASGTGLGAAYDGGGHGSNDVLFVVIDYEFGAGGSPDVAHLWVDPPTTSFGALAPPPAAATFNTASSSAQLVSAADFYLLSRTGSSLWGSLIIGDLRVGDTWAYATGGPEIIVPPANQTNLTGATATFYAQAAAGATNVSPLAYQWQFNGTNLSDGGNIAGSGGPALSISDLTSSDAGTYTVIVSNSLAPVTNSASLVVSDVGITADPSNQLAVAGGTTSFTVSAAGTPPLTYQWQENGTNLADGAASSGTIFSGVHSDTLTLQNISSCESGAVFQCLVSNALGSFTVSSGATLTASDLILLSPPQALTVSPGGTASFAATAAGSGPFSYEWEDGGVPLMDGLSPSGATITGSDTATLEISGVGYRDAGNYGVTVFNEYGARVTSAPVELTVVYTNTTTPVSYVNVKTCGATGDGVTDDTLAFDDAIAAARSGGTNDGIYVPMGRYVISAPLTLTAAEMFGRAAGGWPSETAPMPTLLIRQDTAPGVSLVNGASLHGIAIDYDQGTPDTTNAPAISVQSGGTTISDVRIQNAYDGISTPIADMPGRARYENILILQPAHSGIEISKCYDFVQFMNIEVICPGARCTGPAFSFGRMDEGGYTGLVASNCSIGLQFFTDTATGGDGGFFTGSFADCSMLDCCTDLYAIGDHKIKIADGEFTASGYGAVIDGTNMEFTAVGGRWLANNNQAVQVQQAADVVLDADLFGRAGPVSNTLVQAQDCAALTVKDCQFLPGSTGLELDNLNQQAVIYGNSFEDGGIINEMASNFVAAANLITASPPEALQAIARNGQVALTWNAPLGATGYNLKRAAMSGGPYMIIASLTETNDTDTDVTNGTTYYYVVSAIRNGSESANSSEVSAMPQLPPPSAPTRLTATPGVGQVTLAWAASPGAAAYDVKQSLDSGGPYATIGSTGGTSYTNGPLTNGLTYYFVVCAVNTNGESADSTEASATPEVPLPATPTGLAATASGSQIQLSWNAVAGAAKYNLKRALASGGPYSIIAEPNRPGWSDWMVTHNAAYFYVVSAVNGGGQSADSPEVSVTVTPVMTWAGGGGNLMLSWPGWASGYNVFAATNLTPPIAWTLVSTTPESNNGEFYLNISTTNTGQQFYRLVGP